VTPADGSPSLLDKAAESLAGAEAEFAAGRFNNCANRCYYACFQAAIVALARASIRPAGGANARWGHSFVQAQFEGTLINMRKMYPSALHGNLTRVYILRQTADYNEEAVTEVRASRALRNCRSFVEAVIGIS
jgi:uncharacterized protein (UPF0332 family)